MAVVVPISQPKNAAPAPVGTLIDINFLRRAIVQSAGEAATHPTGEKGFRVVWQRFNNDGELTSEQM